MTPQNIFLTYYINSQGGHTGHDGKFKPNQVTVEVKVETKVHREEKRKGPPAKKSLTDLP